MPTPTIREGFAERTLRLMARYADSCNIGADPNVAHKLEVLGVHCDDLGRGCDAIEKTAMMGIDPTSTMDDGVRTGEEVASVGYAAPYVYARAIRDRAAIIDVVTCCS